MFVQKCACYAVLIAVMGHNKSTRSYHRLKRQCFISGIVCLFVFSYYLLLACWIPLHPIPTFLYDDSTVVHFLRRQSILSDIGSHSVQPSSLRPSMYFHFHRSPPYVVLLSSHHMPIPLQPPFLDCYFPHFRCPPYSFISNPVQLRNSVFFNAHVSAPHISGIQCWSYHSHFLYTFPLIFIHFPVAQHSRHALPVIPPAMQHNNCANTCIQPKLKRRPRGFPRLLRYHTCHLRFAALAQQQALYMMCFAQTAQHLYSLVQTKNRSVLRHRGLDKQNTVEPLTNDHPHQRPSLSYDHISCDGQWFLFVYESLTSDHPSYTTTPMWFWGWSYKRGSTVHDFSDVM